MPPFPVDGPKLLIEPLRLLLLSCLILSECVNLWDGREEIVHVIREILRILDFLSDLFPQQLDSLDLFDRISGILFILPDAHELGNTVRFLTLVQRLESGTETVYLVLQIFLKREEDLIHFRHLSSQ